MNDIQKEYKRWLLNATKDEDLTSELKQMSNMQKEDAFYRNLSFGTGGLRGVIGAGTNRINIYTIAKASLGLANYLNKHYENPSVVIGYDSRIKSDLFAHTAAGIFANSGIHVYIYSCLLPVPCVSYGVRHLKASAGVMITASHNPSIYNGYKVYGDDGCQITTNAADEILAEIESLDVFSDVRLGHFDTLVNEGKITYIEDSVLDSFIAEVKKQSVLYDEEVNKNVSIVYSPLNGAGLKPVTRTLKEMGYTNIFVVPEQENPDGNFPTCPYPNPEIKEAMALGMKYAKEKNADLLIATDPDCDRVGIAVKNHEDEYVLLSGNETGLLLFDYISSQREKHHTMPQNPVLIKTIVTTDLAEKIAEHYNVSVINVLTGFKFIGEQIGLLEDKKEENRYIFGFEESYGYLTGTYVRDKDGVDGAYMICEMLSYYATRGISLLDKLNDLYSTYGYALNTLHSFEFDGSAGVTYMKNIMKSARQDIHQIGSKKVLQVLDYEKGINNLPKSDVIKFILEDNCSVVLRPSGTEPKLKLYLSVCSNDKSGATIVEKELLQSLIQIGGIK